MSKFNTSDPILVVVRRGRGGKGFLVSPIENVSNAAPCVDAVEVGESILEMLNDISQPRVNMDELIGATSSKIKSSKEEVEEDDDEVEEDDDEGYDEEEDNPLAGDGDLADKVIMFGLNSLLQKGRAMSSKKVRVPPVKKRKKKK